MIRLRPKGYFRRFQASIACIYESLSRRIGYGSYLPGISRSRQRHWLRALQRQVAAYLGEGFRGRLLEGFLGLAQRGRVPVAFNPPRHPAYTPPKAVIDRAVSCHRAIQNPNQGGSR